MKNIMSLLYFAFIIINIGGIGALFFEWDNNGLLLLICLLLNFSFFIVTACIKKTRSATIRLILYLTSFICFIIVLIDIIETSDYIPAMPLSRSTDYFLIVGLIALIISYTIVLIQMIRDFIKK